MYCMGCHKIPIQSRMGIPFWISVRHLSGRDKGYRVTAFVKNVFDTHYAALIFANSADLQPNAYIQLVPKYASRTAGVELRYDF